jgi:hypothetical protein
MAIDLTALDAANKALQADAKAAKTVKVFAAEATKVLHAMAATPSPTQPPPTQPPVQTTTNPVPPPKVGALWGSYIEGAKTNAFYYPPGPWSNAPMVDAGTSDSWAKFESDAGKKVALLMFGGGGPDPWLKPFAAQQVYLDLVVARGAIPVLDVSTGSTLLTDYTSGKQDTQITAWAKGAAAWGKPFVFRLNCEMNGTWYNYGSQARSNPTQFTAMWKHFHDLFVAAGAKNVSWHWCPNVDPENSQTPLEQLYPGDAYVDWTGITGYNHGGESVAWTFDTTYNRVTAMSKLPIMLGEIGSVDTNYPGDRIKFIDDLLGAMANGTKYQQVKAFCWFNWRIDEGQGFWDWPIQSSASALTHFKSVIANPYFVGRA